MPAPTFWLDEDGEHVWYRHQCIRGFNGGPVSARLPLNPVNGWTLESADPITVSPSILCLECNTHGFIRNGEWVVA